MQHDFCPTQVPAAVLQDMAKRLSKHPAMTGTSLARCQEIMARTFGHASFHALKSKVPRCRAQEAIANPLTRALFYSLMDSALDAVGPGQAMLRIEQLAGRGGQWALRDLARQVRAELEAGQPLGKALAVIAGDQIPMEIFLLTTIGATSGPKGTLQECENLARQQAHEEDMKRFTGEKA